MNSQGERLVAACRRLQSDYWTKNPAEKSELTRHGTDNLSWGEAFRLLHLSSMELLSSKDGMAQLAAGDMLSDGVPDAPKGDTSDLIRALVNRLSSARSPFRPRVVFIWQSSTPPSEVGTAKPDLGGIFTNASFTHLACLEVVRLDARQEPRELAFVPLDEITAVRLARSAICRYGKLFFEDERDDEVVLFPLIYGISRLSPHEFDRNGSTTRFICKLDLEDQLRHCHGLGIGHQDFAVLSGDGPTLLGLGSINAIQVPLAWDDPRFDEKCRARGIDPDEFRASWTKPTS